MTNLYTLNTAKKKLTRDNCLQYGHSWSDDQRVDGRVSLVYCSHGCGLSVSFPGPTAAPEVEPSLVTDEPLSPARERGTYVENTTSREQEGQ